MIIIVSREESHATSCWRISMANQRGNNSGFHWNLPTWNGHGGGGGFSEWWDGVGGLPARLDGERNLDVADRVSLTVDGAQTDAPVVGVHPLQLRDVSGHLKSISISVHSHSLIHHAGLTNRILQLEIIPLDPTGSPYWIPPPSWIPTSSNLWLLIWLDLNVQLILTSHSVSYDWYFSLPSLPSLLLPPPKLDSVRIRSRNHVTVGSNR